MSCPNIPDYENTSYKEIDDTINTTLLEPLQRHDLFNLNVIDLPAKELEVVQEVSIQRILPPITIEVLEEPVTSTLNSSYKEKKGTKRQR